MSSKEQTQRNKENKKSVDSDFVSLTLSAK